MMVWLLNYLINALWQIPLLFAAAAIAVRVLRRTGPVTEHRVWVSTLLLQCLLPAVSLASFASLHDVLPWPAHHLAARGHVSVSFGPGVAYGTLFLPPRLLSFLALSYLALTAFFFARLLWRARHLSRLRKNAVPCALPEEAALCWQRCCSRFGVQDASLAVVAGLFGPVTLGVRRRLILLPEHMLPGLLEQDFEAVLAHEFAHMQRSDFSWNLLYEILSLPVAFHPLLWLTREHVVETREMVCDRMAAEITGPAQYARSLLRLASQLLRGAPTRTPHAIGILDANTFERRLMQLIESQNGSRAGRRILAVAACTLLGLATCASALALRVNVDAPAGHSSENKGAGDRSKPSKIAGGVMAGNLLTSVNPTYPAAARQAKIQGAVVLHAIIGKDGSVENLQVVSGPRELQASSLDAVRQWTYKPFLLNGEATEVETTITVNFSLF